MSIFLKKIMVVFSFIAFLFSQSQNAVAGPHQEFREVGDVLQIVNPIVTAGFATQEKGLGHFGIVFAQSWAIMGASQYLGNKAKWKIGQRPTINGRKGRYHGFPSGHTTSAWTSAAYARVFFKDYKYLAIPLYASAALTGVSRVKARRHTTTQVIGAVVLSEAVVYLNEKMKWSQNYSGFDVKFGDDGASAGFTIRF